MAFATGRLPVTDRLGQRDLHLARRRPGPCRLVVASSATIPVNAVPSAKPASTSVANAVRQQTRHVVNFKATAADFAVVISRLSLSGTSTVATSQAMGPASLEPAVPQPSPAPAKPWAGLLGNLFGGLKGGAQPEPTDLLSDCVQDDGSPLSHAVVMFTATWCGPCSVVYKELKLAAGRLQGRPPTAIIIIDVEEHKELASELGIKALPTLLYMSPDGTRGPIFTQGPVSAPLILATLDRAVGFGGHDVKAKWLKL